MKLCPSGDPKRKAAAFGWSVREIGGHDMGQIVEMLDAENDTGLPLFVDAHTVKGKGVSFMEGDFRWHGGVPDEAQYTLAMKELGGGLS